MVRASLFWRLEHTKVVKTAYRSSASRRPLWGSSMPEGASPAPPTNQLKQYKAMTQQEFTTRTGVEVGTEEFWHINEVYNSSDADKDAFCRAWRRLNKERVAEAKERRRRLRREELHAEALWHYYERTPTGLEAFQMSVVASAPTRREAEAMGYAGIKLADGMRVADLRYEIGKYFGLN